MRNHTPWTMNMSRQRTFDYLISERTIASLWKWVKTWKIHLNISSWNGFFERDVFSHLKLRSPDLSNVKRLTALWTYFVNCIFYANHLEQTLTIIRQNLNLSTKNVSSFSMNLEKAMSRQRMFDYFIIERTIANSWK